MTSETDNRSFSGAEMPLSSDELEEEAKAAGRGLGGDLGASQVEGDTHLPASEADGLTGAHEDGKEPKGTIPPPD